jgi:hypothetical protein
MKLTPQPCRRLAAGIALGCSAILLPAAALASSAAPGTPSHPAAAVLPLASSARGAAAHPQRRQLAVSTLTGSFKAVLTATRSPGTESGPRATVTAAVYRHTSRGWKLVTTKRIGGASGWFWYSTAVCSFTLTPLVPGTDPPRASNTIRVSLLITPALGCSNTYTKRW